MPEPTPIDTALWRATSVWSRHDRSVIIAEVRRLRSLLARCVDHIDPNDSDDAFRLLVECEEASRG